MITIFSIPKPFLGHINLIQRNAISSWLKLVPSKNIFLIGNDIGVSEVVKEYELVHIRDVEINEFGTPLLNSAFEIMQNISKSHLLLYVNSDIIFTT